MPRLLSCDRSKSGEKDQENRLTDPHVLTPNTNCGKLTKVRNPDQGAKCALVVSIQGPSLAAGDSNALGIGGCAGAEPILHGSALAFLAPETPFRQKNANLPANLERRRLACVPPGENIPAALTGIYGLLWHLSRESGSPDGWNPFFRRKRENLAGDSISQTPPHATTSPGVVDQQTNAPLRLLYHRNSVLSIESQHKVN